MMEMESPDSINRINYSTGLVEDLDDDNDGASDLATAESETVELTL